MMNKEYSIDEISLQEYQNGTPSQRLLESDFPRYYYRIKINTESYFIDANGDKSRFDLAETNDEKCLILGSEDRVYIFSLSGGHIKLALRTFDPILEFRVLDDHVLIFTQKLMMVLDAERLYLYTTHHFPDLIEDIIINGREVTVVCFETAPIKVRI